MQILIPAANLPTTAQLSNTEQILQQVLLSVKDYSFSLTKEIRSGSYKMGPRRLAYSKAALRGAKLNIDAMPRSLEPNDFEATLAAVDRLQTIKGAIEQLLEAVDDTLMAARIDSMTYTRQVHESFKLANSLNASYDSILSELDDFNVRASADDTDTGV